MTAHANCTHPTTKAARAACRKERAVGRPVRELDTHALFIHPATRATVRVIGYEFGYVKYLPATAPIPTGWDSIFTEIHGSTLVNPA